MEELDQSESLKFRSFWRPLMKLEEQKEQVEGMKLKEATIGDE